MQQGVLWNSTYRVLTGPSSTLAGLNLRMGVCFANSEYINGQ